MKDRVRMKERVTLRDFGQEAYQLIRLQPEDLSPLPPPYDHPEDIPPIEELTEEQRQRYEASLDGVLAIGIPKPKSREEGERLVQGFLSGLKKLLSPEDNWTFLQPLAYSLEYCAKCQICNDACPIYTESGRKEIYRPTYRSEVLRRIVGRYIKGEKGLLAKFTGNELELNWLTVTRLAELSYRCTLCRRCAQVCPIGVDNGLIAHELRKLFSQELGIAPKELHELGTVQQLRVGSSTGITPEALTNLLEFMEDEIEEKVGHRIKIPVDVEGAEVLLIHNAGEFLSWPENIEAFTILFEALGVKWTLSSKLVGYDAVNYGVWYDDVQLARIALRHAQVARELGVKMICVGECGHAHKAIMVVADRVLTGEYNIPRVSAIPFMRDAVVQGRLNLDPKRNDFPVTLHDPCNLVRLSGIVKPQREILERICPRFREMEPHGVTNYCCGGGSGFAIMGSMNFPSWRFTVAGRKKFAQILEAFRDDLSPETKKYVCAPCSNCKGQLRDMLGFYGAWQRCGIMYGGLVELIVNAMADLKKPFIEWEWH